MSTGSSRSRARLHLRRLTGRTENAPERHTQQYFEAVGNRAMYKDGWWLAMRLPRIPWLLDPEALRHFGPGWNPDADPVELYYLPDDFSQAKNLAEQHPEKVTELRKLFWEEAGRYQVLPILGGLSSFYGSCRRSPRCRSSPTGGGSRTLRRG